MNKIKQLIHAILIIVVIGAFSACEKTFDAPPGAGEVNIVANTSIQALKTYHTIPGVYDLINEDVIISGIVVANDQSGNGLNGVVNGAILTSDRFGNSNSAYVFDGNSKIRCAFSNQFSPDASDNYSFSFWAEKTKRILYKNRIYHKEINILINFFESEFILLEKIPSVENAIEEFEKLNKKDESQVILWLIKPIE